jgi:hypothetical protein
LAPNRNRPAGFVDAALIAAAAGAAAQIVQWTWSRPLWLDEEMIALNLRDRGWLDLAGPLWLGQAAPLGWLALQHLALVVFGTSERALRLIPLLFGIGTVAIAVRIGRRWMTPIAALVLALLCGFGLWLTFYSLELKPYSADAFWALLLPAVTAWALEPLPPGPEQTRRVVWFWVATAAGHWFANGALLVTPACVVVLLAIMGRRHGTRAAWDAAAPGLLWLGSFGLHYRLSLRYTVGSEYLRSYWSFALPPPASGLTDRIRWVALRIIELADDPGGSGFRVAFWIAAAAGVVLGIRTHPALGAIAALIPLSAMLLAASGVVPMNGRLSLWIVPASYVGIAMLADAGVRIIRRARARRSPLRAALALAIALAVLAIVVDALKRDGRNFDGGRRLSNHELNDRAAIEWLIGQQQPGDLWIATHQALPAVWWYAGVPLSSPTFGGHRPDGSPILEVSYEPPGPACRSGATRRALGGHSRALVYVASRFDAVPNGFGNLLLNRLGELGSVTAYRSFSELGAAAVVDLRLPPSGADVAVRLGRVEEIDRADAAGCLHLEPARLK